jgi:hydrogenase nickel incorporation protein HypB
MCRDCGCSSSDRSAEIVEHHHRAHESLAGPHQHHAHQPPHEHAHKHDAEHGDHHHHDDAEEIWVRNVAVGRSLLELNDHLAEHNRARFAEHGVLVLNLMSSPGAGKTRLLELTLGDLANQLRMAAVVGDLQTDNDARRLRATGGKVLSITTGTMCHLEADMVGRASAELDLANLDVLFVENVGNLVCPASFDLGEAVRVVLMSVTEGEDKPLKYPPVFKRADVVIVTKLDLADAAGCDMRLVRENIHRVAPQAQVIELSARTGDGLERWYQFLQERVPPTAGAPASGILDGADI